MIRAVFVTVCIVALSSSAASCRRPESDATRAAAAKRAAEALRTPGAPTPEDLTKLWGVQVDQAAGEVNQYLIRGPQGSVDLTKIGTIHSDVGYAVGVTLRNGVQIGFRFEPLPDAQTANPQRP